MKSLLLLGAIFLNPILLFAQDFEFSKIPGSEIALKNYSKDTSAAAVVLEEFGTAYISNSTYNTVLFEHHVRIKIFNSKGFDQGTITIPLRRRDANTFDKISGIKAVTYYTDENGQLQKSILSHKDIFTEKTSKYLDLAKFTMPNLKDGCIIEYKYQVELFSLFNFKTWEFQGEIPKIKSEYEVKIPAVYNYNVMLRGYLKIDKNPMEILHNCYSPGAQKIDCSKISYIMFDVPAFVEEEHMTATKNFKAALYFELSDYIDYNGVKHKFSKEWKDVDLELNKDPSFGAQLKKKDLFTERVTPIITGVNDNLNKAKAVYSYIQKWFKWNEYYGIHSSDGLKKALESHTGNIADINLSLIAALNSIEIKAEPLILSTRENGILSDLFPVLSNFNYVICKADIDGKTYLLDATDKLLPFGLLPLRCLNERGRVISSKIPSYWHAIEAPAKELQINSANFSLQNNGKLTGTITTFSSAYEAYNVRKSIKKYASLDEYVEAKDENMPTIKILKYEISNVDSLHKTVSEVYEVEISAFDNLNKANYLFNPFIINKTTKNPFKLDDRIYPVDWGIPSESKMTVSISFPPQFKISSIPEPMNLSLPENGGKYFSQITMDGNDLTLLQHKLFNKAVYQAQEYPALKELYNKIIQSQKADITLTKNK